ncbi:MAG: AbrB/MazE/SpoVT family DNA-binding domain-containing protein [Pseudomonadota bacterium]|nr:AbrB/MazE/SpoVT family DNA-binding domain-containing protein [Pseudomonadota bacterium]
MNALIDKRTTTNMTSKGQVLIPKDVRDAIGLVPGRPVEVGINDRGEAVVMPTMKRAGEAPAERSARIMAALDRASMIHRTGRSTVEMMRELRGDDPLP